MALASENRVQNSRRAPFPQPVHSTVHVRPADFSGICTSSINANSPITSISGTPWTVATNYSQSATSQGELNEACRDSILDQSLTGPDLTGPNISVQDYTYMHLYATCRVVLSLLPSSITFIPSTCLPICLVKIFRHRN